MSTRGILISVFVLVLLVAGGIVAYNRFTVRDAGTDVNRCVAAPQKVADTITAGLVYQATGDPASAVMIATRAGDRDSTGWPKAIVAMRVTPPGQPEAVAVWGTGDPKGLVLPITSLNTTASAASRWGIRETGNLDPQAEQQQRFASSLDETTLAVECVNAR